MWVFMLSFAGFPLTGGFLGKFYVFSAAFEAGWWWLVVIGVVATAVSIAYYLGIVRAMYMRPDTAIEPSGGVAVSGGAPPSDPALGAALTVAIGVVIGSFVFVQPLVDRAAEAIAQLPL
jgi:NADH-quinone oxidoreductase subunit N